MGSLRAIGFSAVLAVLLAGSASAQQAQKHEGFWIGGGLGYGSMGISCDGCGNTDRSGAPSAYLALGGALRQNILLGVETNVWTKSELGARLTMTNISGAVYWYPMTSNGMFVKAGAGFSALDSGFGGGSSGFGVLGGVGYDVPVARNLSITPVANWFRGGFNGGSANVLQIGVGVTSH